jgi:tungstate transport system ATP-binding protein
MNHSIYRIRNLAKEYAGRVVLQVDELEIMQGEVFALIGPSGAGKSTLLRLLNFLEPPTRGSIIFEDVEVNSDREAPLGVRRRVTTVFQRPMLLDMSVLDNVRYGLGLRGQRDSRDQALEVLELVGLAHLALVSARTLSGGEAQRVALARAIVLHPDVLLLDEPTANLDPYNVGQIEEIAAQLNREQGTTLVLVTHNVFQARRLAGRVALMLEGRIVEASGAAEFFQAPQDPRTAAFVRGEMVY